jgi:hypothetical protein
MPAYFSKNAKLNDKQKAEQAAKDALWEEEDERRKEEDALWEKIKALQKEQEALRKEKKALQKEQEALWEKEDALCEKEDALWKKEDALCEKEDALWKKEDVLWKKEKARRFHEYADRAAVDYYRSIEPIIVVSDKTLTATVKDDRWQIVNIYCATLPKRGKVKIYAKDRGVDSKPRLRIYHAEENENSDWRKADHKGYSSAGGQGDGFSKPEELSGMHPVVKELFQHGEALMATIDIENGDSSVKFHNWTEKFDLPFSTDCNSCIVVAFKGYSVRIVVE